MVAERLPLPQLVYCTLYTVWKGKFLYKYERVLAMIAIILTNGARAPPVVSIRLSHKWLSIRTSAPRIVNKRRDGVRGMARHGDMEVTLSNRASHLRLAAD